MTEVDFYILHDAENEAILRTACRITQKAWSQGLRVYILSNTDEEAGRMDDLLWTFQQDSFVPHERWNGAGDAHSAPGPANENAHQAAAQSAIMGTSGTMASVLIGTTAQPPTTPQLLINLGAPVPDWFSQCLRVAEIVGADPHRKAESRQRYRAYREHGVPLRTHEV